ncbi:MAG: MFS transporter [Planctomycetota bacterium]
MAAADEKNISDIDRQIEDAFPRNMKMTIAWEGLWGIGAPCCVYATMIPAYLLMLDMPKWLIQSVMVWFTISTTIQLFNSRIIHGAKRLKRVFLVWVCYTLCWTSYGLAAKYLWDNFSPNTWAGIFIVTCAVFSVFMALGTPSYNAFLVGNTPIKKRGKLSAIRLFLIGVTGVGGFFFVTWLYKQWEAPHNYHSGFYIGGTLMLISCFSLLFNIDNAWKKEVNTSPPIIKSAKKLLTNINFRVFLIFYIFLFASQTLVPLFISYGKDTIPDSSDLTTKFIGAQYAGVILISILTSLLADRYGFKILAIISAIFMIISFITAILVKGSLPAALLCYSLSFSSIVLGMIMLPNLASEIVPDISTAMIVAITNTCIAPIAALIAPLTGWIIDLHGTSGYLAVFTLGTGLSACALLGFIAVVREPRSGQELYIRIRRM